MVLRFDVEQFLTNSAPVIDIEAVVSLVVDYRFARPKIISFTTWRRASDILRNSLPILAIFAEMIISEFILECERALIALELLLIHNVANVHIDMICSDKDFMTTSTVFIVACAYTIIAVKFIASSALDCIFDDQMAFCA